MTPFARSTAVIAITLVPMVGWTDGPFDWFKAGKHRDHKGFNIKHGEDPQEACGIIEVAHSLDAIEEGIADDGIIAIKRPDVWGQNRMSQYRVEFEKEMAKELDKFRINLQARVAQADQSAFMQTSALGLSLANQKRGSSTTVNSSTPSSTSPTGDLGNVLKFLQESNVNPTVKLDLSPSSAGASAPSPPAPEKPGSPEQLAQAMEMLKQDFAANTIARSKPLELLAAATDALKELDQTKGGLGVEPPIYLDQKKRYLDALHQIRRVNLGDDTADSVGYGMYLIRMPVSLLPGHRTKDGWGAEVQSTARHAFSNNFTARTYKNLVINDLVDQLTPLLYELIRSGAVEANKNQTSARKEIDRIKSDLPAMDQFLASMKQANHLIVYLQLPDLNDESRDTVERLLTLIVTLPIGDHDDIDMLHRFRTKLSSTRANIDAQTKDEFKNSIQSKKIILNFSNELDLAEALGDKSADTDSLLKGLEIYSRSLQNWSTNVKSSMETLSALLPNGADGKPYVRLIELEASPVLADMILAVNAIAAKYQAEILRYAKSPNTPTNSLDAIQKIRNSSKAFRTNDTLNFAQADAPTESLTASFSELLKSDAEKQEERAFQINEFAREKIDSISDIKTKELERKLADVVERVNQANVSVNILRSISLKIPSSAVARVGEYGYPIAPNDIIRGFLPDNLFAIGGKLSDGLPTRDVTSSEIRAFLAAEIEVAYDLLSKGFAGSPPILSQVELLQDVQSLLQKHSYDDVVIDARAEDQCEYTSCFKCRFLPLLPEAVRNNKPMVALCWAIVVDAVLLDQRLKESMTEYSGQRGFHCDQTVEEHFFYVPDPSPETEEAFESYVKARWPIVCFALDPVVQQQNIQDRFALRRDLQLAMAYAFAIGKVSFNQVNKFQRRIEYDAETIELNQTVHSFAAGNDSFGWRFTPRFQNPPMEGSNIGAFTRTVFNSAPTERFRRRHAEIEPGQREVTVVLLMPSFLEGITMHTSTSWFKLNQPDDKLVSSERMLVQGQKIEQLREALGRASNEACFRGEDIEGMQARIDRLENMLPMQTQNVPVPFENTQSGFDLFRPGAFGLAPRLLAFEGIERVDGANPEKQPALSVLLYGKNFHLNATEVIVGGYRIDSNTSAMQMLSREVIAITFPAGSVFPTVMKEGDPKTYVEIHVATPNGISDGLLIPYDAKKPAPANASLTLATTELKVQFKRPASASVMVTSVDSKLRVKWTDPLGSGPPNVSATLSYSPDSRPTMTATSVASEDAADGDYKFDLKAPIEEILNRIAAQTPPMAIPGEINAKVAIVPVNPRKESKTLDGTIKITLEEVSR